MNQIANELNQQLQNICHKLGGLNYVCSIEVFSGKWIKGKQNPNYSKSNSIDVIIKSIFGEEARTRNTRDVSFDEMMDIFDSCIGYSGSEGHYPNKKYFKTDGYYHDLNKLKKLIQNFFDNPSKIIEFEFIHGHPFYPGFWEFAFLIKTGDVAFCFIGSSGD